MSLTTIFSLFVTHQDNEAKELLADYLASTPSASNIIQEFLTNELRLIKAIESLEAIDLFCHFAGLRLVSKENGGNVEEFQLTVSGIEDLETYNRCGRRELQQVINPAKLSFFNDKTGLNDVIDINNVSSFFEVIP